MVAAASAHDPIPAPDRAPAPIQRKALAYVSIFPHSPAHHTDLEWALVPVVGNERPPADRLGRSRGDPAEPSANLLIVNLVFGIVSFCTSRLRQLAQRSLVIAEIRHSTLHHPLGDKFFVGFPNLSDPNPATLCGSVVASSDNRAVGP